MTWVIEYWDEAGASWVEVSEAKVKEIIREMNFYEQARISLPNTADNRNFVSSNKLIRISYNGNEIFKGLFVQAKYSIHEIEFTGYNEMYLYLFKKYAVEDFSGGSSLSTIANTLLGYSGWSYSLSVDNDPTIGIAYKYSNVWDALIDLAIISNQDFWIDYVSGTNTPYVHFGTKGVNTGLTLDISTNSEIEDDRGGKIEQVTVIGYDEDGNELVATAGSGNTEIIYFNEPTTLSELQAYANKKLEEYNTEKERTRINVDIVQASVLNTGDTVTLVNDQLGINGAHRIYKITWRLADADIEVDRISPQLQHYFSKVAKKTEEYKNYTGTRIPKITVIPDIVPSPPSVVTVVANELDTATVFRTWLDISFDSVENAGGYVVEYCECDSGGNPVSGAVPLIIELGQKSGTISTSTLDLKANTQYYVRVACKSQKGTQGDWSNKYIVTTATNDTAPSVPTGLTAVAGVDGVKLFWNDVSANDFDYYVVYYGTSDPPTSVAGEVRGTSFFWKRGDGEVYTTYYFAVSSVDTAGNESAKCTSISETPLQVGNVNIAPNAVDTANIIDNAIKEAKIDSNAVTSDKISAGSVTAEKLAVYSVFLDGFTWTDNSPSAGYVSWSGGIVTYGGTTYSIIGGNTNNKYIYWNVGDTTFSTSDTLPSFANNRYLIAYNDNGTVVLLWNITYVHGGQIITDTVNATCIKADTLVGSERNRIMPDSKVFKVVSVGMSATSQPSSAGLYDARTGNLINGAGRSYNVSVYDRNTNEWISHTTYDVYGSVAQADAMASALNSLDSSKIVFIYAYDEPQNNRLGTNNSLLNAMLRCGASSEVFGASNDEFKFRSAYILVGIPDIGEGNGIELYSGDIDNDPDAWCETTVVIENGNLTTLNKTTMLRISADKIHIDGEVYLTDWSHSSDATKIDGGKIYTGSITADQIAANTITADKIKANAIQLGFSRYNCVVHAKFDSTFSKNGYTYVPDFSGSENDVRLYGNTYLDVVGGSWGKAVNVPDTSSSAATDTYFDINGKDLTLEVRFMVTSYTTYDQPLCGIKYAWAYGFGIYIGPNGNFKVATRNPDGAQTFTTSKIISINEWYHAIITYDASNNQMDVYVDGELIASYNPSRPPNVSAQLLVGRTDNPNVYFHGWVDEVRFYMNRYFSSDEALASFRAGAITEMPTLITDKMITSAQIVGKDFRTAYNVGESGGPAGVRFDANGIRGYTGGTNKSFEIGTDGVCKLAGGQFQANALNCMFKNTHYGDDTTIQQYVGYWKLGVGGALYSKLMFEPSNLRTNVVQFGHNYVIPDPDLCDPTYGYGYLGTSIYNSFWRYIYGYYIRYKSLGSFQEYDDLEVLKNMKEVEITDKNGKKKHVIDKKSAKILLGDEEQDNEDGFYDLGKVTGFIICASKRILERLERLEAEIEQIKSKVEKSVGSV